MNRDITPLTTRVQGPVLLPDSEGYDAECTGFNLAVRHRPAVVVGALGPQDVRAAVEFAAGHGLPVAVCGTGHGFSVPADDGVLVSTRRMTEVRVDPVAGTAYAAAGARWGQVVEAAAVHGLAPLNGSAPHVGVVSYTLGGGLPLLGRSHGWAADRVRSLDVVTADGELRHVTPDGSPDLYWALLGGRDNFGVVTGLEFELVPVSRLYGGGLFFDAVEVPDLLAGYLRWARTVPEEMNSSVALVPFRPAPPTPEPLRGRHAYHVRIAFTGSAEEGARLVAPLRDLGPRLLESVTEMPYTRSASIHNDPPFAMPWAADNLLLGPVDEVAVNALLEHTGPGAAQPTIMELRPLGGALARRRADRPNAVGHRNAAYLVSVLGAFQDESVAECHTRLERAVKDLAPWTVGRFVNFMGHGENADPQRVRTAYEPADLARLAALKAVHDPGNVFRANLNIPPSAR